MKKNVSYFSVLSMLLFTFSNSSYGAEKEFDISPDKVLSHSFEIQMADAVLLDPNYKIKQPSYFKAIDPKNPGRKIYFLFSQHNVPLEFVLPRKEVSKIADLSFFVTEENLKNYSLNSSDFKSILKKFSFALVDDQDQHLQGLLKKAIWPVSEEENKLVSDLQKELRKVFQSRFSFGEDLSRKIHPSFMCSVLNTSQQFARAFSTYKRGMDNTLGYIFNSRFKNILGLERAIDRILAVSNNAFISNIQLNIRMAEECNTIRHSLNSTGVDIFHYSYFLENYKKEEKEYYNFVEKSYQKYIELCNNGANSISISYAKQEVEGWNKLLEDNYKDQRREWDAINKSKEMNYAQYNLLEKDIWQSNFFEGKICKAKDHLVLYRDMLWKSRFENIMTTYPSENFLCAVGFAHAYNLIDFLEGKGLIIKRYTSHGEKKWESFQLKNTKSCSIQ